MQQSSDEHVVIKLLALSVALLPVIVASGVLYNRASGIPLSQALYKVGWYAYTLHNNNPACSKHTERHHPQRRTLATWPNVPFVHAIAVSATAQVLPLHHISRIIMPQGHGSFLAL